MPSNARASGNRPGHSMSALACLALVTACGGSVGYEVPEEPAPGAWTVDAALTSGGPDCARFVRVEAQDLSEPFLVERSEPCRVSTEQGERATRYACGADAWAVELESEDVATGTYWAGVYGPAEGRCTYRFAAWR